MTSFAASLSHVSSGQERPGERIGLVGRELGARLCLPGFSYLAVGAAVPWRGLLLAYGAGQLAANLPITPGGLGVVEGSLVIALVAFGGGHVSTVAAVLLYRIVSFWGYLPVGWLAWAGLTWHNRRVDKLAALTAEVPVLHRGTGPG